MKADAFLSRCQKVKRTGRGTWIACCPAHDDKNPSMTVRELEDGRVLVHCFAGCSVENILSAVSLDFDALFPDKLQDDGAAALRRPFPAADVLEALAAEVAVVMVAACNIANKVELTDADRERLMTAYHRIDEARRLALHSDMPEYHKQRRMYQQMARRA